MATQDFTDLAGRTVCLSSAGLAIATSAIKVKTAAPNGAGVDYMINGKFYHKADTDNLFTLSGTALAASEICIFLLCLNSSGTASIVQGDIVDAEDVYNGLVTVPYPPVPADKCSVGALVVECNSAAGFTPGTTLLSASNVTDTYINFATPPNKGLSDADIANTTFA